MKSHQTQILTAARVYLGLEQVEIAKITGLTAQTISLMENGKSSPTERTMRRIRNVYEDKGIVFTSNGLEYQPYKTAIFKDFLDILDDAEKILKKGDEILLHCADENRSTPEVTAKFDQLRSKGVRIRMTCEQGNNFVTGNKKDYRWITPELFANSQVEVIYKDKYIFHFMDGNENIFLMTKNKNKADSAKKQFEYNWKHGSKSWEIDQTT